MDYVTYTEPRESVQMPPKRITVIGEVTELRKVISEMNECMCQIENIVCGGSEPPGVREPSCDRNSMPGVIEELRTALLDAVRGAHRVIETFGIEP